jgi:hypothetical protein
MLRQRNSYVFNADSFVSQHEDDVIVRAGLTHRAQPRGLESETATMITS